MSSAGLLSGIEYSYDRRGNLLAISKPNSGLPDASFQYDGLGQLTDADGYWGQENISYDYVGNITGRQIGANDLLFEYSVPENRLDAIKAGEARFRFTYDQRGNVTSNGLYSYRYNALSQLVQVGQLPDLRLRYDGHGRRTIVEDGDVTELTVFGSSGQLLYRDACESGGEVSEFLYLGGELVAQETSECTEGCHP
jgi:hypothetical protein